MNKVVALSLVSIFILSILVGYIPALVAQAQTSSPQTYVVQISPPYYVAVVITGVNLGLPQDTGLIGYELNKTLNSTTITVSVVNVQNGQTVYSFSGHAEAGSGLARYFEAYYSPAADAVVILYALNQTSVTTISMGDIIYAIHSATGISLINATYPYLIDVYGHEVYSNESAYFVTANDIYNSAGQTLSSQTFFGTMTSPGTLQINYYELTFTVNPRVFTPVQEVVAPSASALLFVPISLASIFNSMMGGSYGAGRTLINATVFNALESSTTNYLYQLNYTGPGLLGVQFYPALQFYSVDQLYLQRPEVGLFSFTGQGTGLNAFNYTIVVISYSQFSVTLYYNGGKTKVNVGTPLFAQVPFTFYVYQNGKYVPVNVTLYMTAFTFTNSLFNGFYLNPVGTSITFTYDGNQYQIPVESVYVGSSPYALCISGAEWFYYNTQTSTVESLSLSNFSLTMTSQLPLKPFTVNTQLQTTAYEEVPSSFYYGIGGMYFSGPILTTPPGYNNFTGTYTLSGNATIGRTYTTVYITGFGNFKFEQLNSTEGRISILGTLATPAYPLINGTAMTGVNIMAETYNYYSDGIEYVFVNVTNASYFAIYNPTGQQNPSNALTLEAYPFTFIPFYGQYVKYSSTPAVQIISPSTGMFTLGVKPQYFYETLVDLGLWSNMTIVYVKGYAEVNGQWYPMYGTRYFEAIIIPPAVRMSSVTTSSFVCNNGVWVDFISPDDVEVTFNNMQNYGMVVTTLPYVKVSGAQINTAANLDINVQSLLTEYFLYANYIEVPLNSIEGPTTYLITNYPGISNYTEQTNVPGGLVITGVMPNGVPLNWTDYTPGVNEINDVYYVIEPDVVPTPVPRTLEPTPNFNVTVYLRYQLDYAAPFNLAGQIMPDFYYGPNNTVIVVTPPNLTVGTTITISFASGDYAVHHYFTKNYWNRTVTIQVPNTTLALKAPSFVPLYSLSVPLQLIEPYYAAPYPAQLAIGTNSVTLVANTYDFLGVTTKAGAVGLGRIVSVTIKFANGTTEKIYLFSTNITTLFQGGVLNEDGSCTGAYNATISVSGLETLLHLTEASQLNGSVLTITYYDNITHTTATVRIHFGAVSVILPIAAEPALIFYVLTAKYVNATSGLPVTLAQSVAVQPYVSLNDTFLAKAMTGVVANLNVTNVTIIDHYGNKYVIYYNSTNGSTNVMINGVVKYAFKGYLMPTIPETAPNTGVFNGSPITFVINMPGTIYKNGTVFNGTLAVMLGTNEATLGPATNFALPAYSFAGKLFGYNSTMYVTVEDAVSGSVLTLKTYIAAYNITPIRIAPVTMPVPMPANASTKIEYVYNQPITLTPTNQYIVIHVTSIVNYTYVFYIATLVQQGKNATTVPPILVNFQTVVPVPVIGPGIVAQVPVQFSQIGALGSGYYTITMFAVPFAGGPVISLYPAKLVFTNVYVNTTVV